MKKFVVKIIIFFILLALLDFLVGKTVAYMSKNAKGGYVMHDNYITDGTHEDILIFGSSRAAHHYNPQIFEDSLGLTCYNCGQEGQCIILFWGWWNVIKEHYKPKYIIYDVYPLFDVQGKEDANQGNVGMLKDVYERTNIKDIFNKVDPKEKYKMISQMYRYNSKFHQIMADYIYPIYQIPKNGYQPLQGSLDPLRIKTGEKIKNMHLNQHVDTLKLHFWKEFINDLQGTKLILVASPEWYGDISKEELTPIINLCKQYGIPFIDYSHNPSYVHNNDLFVDGSHLNAKGADIFTNAIVTEIKKLNLVGKN